MNVATLLSEENKYDLRKSYLQNKITLNQFKELLRSNELKLKKYENIKTILQLFINACLPHLNKVITTKEDFINFQNNIEYNRITCNKLFDNVGTRYNSVPLEITEKFEMKIEQLVNISINII